MLRRIQVHKLFLVGMVGTGSAFGLAYFYAERKIVANVDPKHYLIGIAISLCAAFLASWVLSESPDSSGKDELESQDDSDSANKLGQDRSIDSQSDSLKKQLNQLGEQNTFLSNKIALLEQEQTNFLGVKSKVEQQSLELGKMLAEKEINGLVLQEHHQKITRENDEKREQLEQEISRRKQIQGTLEANEQRYRGMIEGASDALILSSSAGVVEYASPASEDLFGIPPQDLLGSEFDYAIADDAKALKSFIEKSVNKSAIVYRVECAKKGQETVQKYISHHLSYLDIPGKRRILIHSLRDVSAIKLVEVQKSEYEKQLFHASKLASLGTMGAGIAHELNNPLSVIKGYSEKMRGDLLVTLGDSHETIRHLDKILKQIIRMRTIIDQLRVFSRKDSGHEVVLVEADRLFNDALILQRHQLSGSRVALEVCIPDNVPLLKVNVTHFESVIQNLVANAFDAHLSRSGGSALQNEHPWIRISYNKIDDKTVEILVEDNAGGIPKDVLNKIFDPFFTTKDPGKGTGLGLALVQSIVADHQGTIQVSSEVGKGTRFQITLPQPESAATQDLNQSA